MSKEDLKRRVCEAIRARRADIKAVAESVFAEPELGFKETKTSDKIKAEFEKLGLTCETGWGITGVRARMKGKKSKKTVALLGELDAIICRDHPHADPKTGAAHCCGHHVQLANMLAVGMAFKDAGIMDELDGDLMLFAVPAEEYVEIDFRNGLREKGDLRYLGGKQQLIAEGAFDGIEKKIARRLNTQAVGYGQLRKERVDTDDIMQYVLPQDLKSFGLIPELIGRIPVLTYLEPLDRAALRSILTEPKNAIVRQYVKLFEMDGIALSFDDDALDYIVDKAVEYRLGARGLRSICEAVMMDSMFELPSRKNSKKSFTVTLDYARSKIDNEKFRRLKAVS